jgi:hypothetical protein
MRKQFTIGVTALCLAAILSVSFSSAQEKLFKDSTLQDYYELHAKHLKEMLPPHSGLPPILNLSKRTRIGHPKDHAWELRSSELMSSKQLIDPGLTGPGGPTTTMTIIVDGDPNFALSAKSYDVIVARPTASEVRIAFNDKLVYSHFDLEVLQVLKGDAKHGLYSGAHISSFQLGGMIRFPSGHEEAFILIHNGFLEIGQKYILFLWKINCHVESYGIATSYFIENKAVFPIRLDDATLSYSGMPLQTFEAKVKQAIAKNIDTN